MKILILTQTFPLNKTDPTAHFMLDFTKGFNAIGHSATVVAPFTSGLDNYPFLKTFKYIWPDKLHLLGFGRSLKNDQTLRLSNYLLIPFYILFGIIASIKTIKDKQIDVINAHWIVPNGLIGAIASRLTNTPLFITIPGSDAFLSNQNFLFKIVYKIAAKQATKIISNSPNLLQDLELGGEVISYGVPANKSRRKTSQTISIATAGRNVEKKGFDIVVKAVPEVEIIQNLSIVQFRKKLLSVDVFIAHSIRDSKGNLDDASLTVLEAMSAGCAVVATSLPGYQKIITDGQNGLLVSSPEDLKRAVNRLQKSKKLRQKLGKNARKTIKDNFTPEKTAKMYISLFTRNHGS